MRIIVYGGRHGAARTIAQMVLDRFEESKIKRDPDGKFGEKAGGDVPAPVSKKAGMQAAPPDRNSWPEHIKALKVPPGWTDVHINPDPKADLMATGRDAKGRLQPVYSPAFHASQAQAKFQRIAELNEKFGEVLKQNKASMKSADPKVADHAAVMDLIMAMGVRPGSETDTGADKKAYGATTLEGRHVVAEGKQTFLRFTGKKGVDLNLKVEDPELAKALRQRAKDSGPDRQIFPRVSDGSLLAYTHTLGGGGFKTKDFRTLLGTRTAMSEVANAQAPTDEKSYKKAVKDVATTVSKKLGNTPTIALQSYISPTVFAEWRSKVGI